MNPSAPWSIAGASARGTSHRKHNLPCQDAFAVKSINDEWIALAVADGAGSAELSDIGSRIAVLAATAAIREECLAPGAEVLANEGNLSAALQRTAAASREAVLGTAKLVRCSPRQLASTLVLVVAGPSLTAALHIGDGAVVIESVDGRLTTLSKPDTGEFMGESTFLVSSHALDRARVSFAPEARSIALFSDGIQLLTLQYPSWEPFEPFFRQTFSFMSSLGRSGATDHLETFVSSDRLASRTDDDITLLLATRAIALAAAAAPATVEPTTDAIPAAAPAAAAAAAISTLPSHEFKGTVA